MSWKLIFPVCAVLLLAAPASTLAEDEKPNSSPFKQYTCDQKHELCIGRCIRSGSQGSALNRCQEDCAGKWLKCKGVAARTGSGAEVATTQPAPTRK